MKKLMMLLSFLISSNIAFAGNDPFQIETQDCVKQEIKNQFSIFSKFELSHVNTVAIDSVNFNYIIQVTSPETNRYIDRIFINVEKANYAKATLSFSPNFKNTINLKNCF